MKHHNDLVPAPEPKNASIDLLAALLFETKLSCSDDITEHVILIIEAQGFLDILSYPRPQVLRGGLRAVVPQEQALS